MSEIFSSKIDQSWPLDSQVVGKKVTSKQPSCCYIFTEIVDGHLKNTMRLVLAIAAHFKPESFNHNIIMGSSFVKTPVQSTATKVQNSSGKGSVQRTPSLISLASDAAASLAEASKNASSGGNSLPQCKHR